MTTIISTLNSIYEIDKTNLRVRRLFGANAPTRRLPSDGLWSSCEAIDVAHLFGEDKESLVITWGSESPRNTVTSTIISSTEVTPPNYSEIKGSHAWYLIHTYDAAYRGIDDLIIEETVGSGSGE